MITKELNNYFKNYLENDISHRAVMLNADWGSGKTFYVKNELMKSLDKKCVYVSLYGIKDTEELNKELYLEIKLKKSQHPRLFKARKYAEVFSSTVAGVGKTILKNLCHVDLDIDWKSPDLEKLYESVNLKDKLIILDDLERSKINIIELLGYINNLEEHDEIKVLIVANEREILKYENIEKNGKTQSVQTQETLDYLKIKEKTICDTIYFYCDYKTSVTQIAEMFYEKDKSGLFQDVINLGGNNTTIEKIINVMQLTHKGNLRSIIYACQKTVDLFNKFTKKYDLTFLQNLFLGIIAYCLKNNQNEDVWWQTKELVSSEFGIRPFPMYRFAFEFIKYQYFNESDVDDIQTLFEIARRQEEANENLQTLYSYYEQSEIVVRQAISDLLIQLKDKKAISNSIYLQIINYLISAKSILNNEEQVEQAKNIIYNNIQTSIRNNEKIDLNQSSGIVLNDKEEKEFEKFKQSIYDLLDNSGLDEKDSKVDVEKFCKYAHNNQNKYVANRSFMNSFNLEGFVEALKNATAKEIYDIRGVFQSVYNLGNVREFFSADLPKIKILQEKLNKLKNLKNYDSIQKQQIEWFIGNLEEIIKKLQGDKDV